MAGLSQRPKIQGAKDRRVSTFRVQTSGWGHAIPIVYGRNRVAGNLIFYSGFRAIPVTAPAFSGGKGGGSNGSLGTTNYEYHIDLMVALCEGPIQSIGTIWTTKELMPVTFLVDEQKTAPASAPGGFFHIQLDNKPIRYVGVSIDDGKRTFFKQVSSNPGPKEYLVDFANGVITFNAADLTMILFPLRIGPPPVIWQQGSFNNLGQFNGSKWTPIKINFSIATAPTVFLFTYGYGVNTPLNQLSLSLFPGTYPTQGNWALLDSKYKDKALGYPGTAMVVGESYNMGPSNSLPNFNFEVYGFLPFGGYITDAEPSAIISDFLTNDQYGANFPSSLLGDLTSYRTYCIAEGIFLSPVFDTQKPAAECIKEIFDLSNSAPVWSEGVLKIIPYGDTTLGPIRGATYTPNTTPIYDLTDNDYLGDNSSDPIVCTRSPNADAPNHIQLEFLPQPHFNAEIVDLKDQASIDRYGLRPIHPIQAHQITRLDVGQTVARIILQKNLYIRNQYSFMIGWKYCLLEPMDLVTVTDSALGLNQKAVRILSIEENEEGTLSVIAEDFPGIASATLYPSQLVDGHVGNINKTAPDVAGAVFLEPPDALVTSGLGLEVWIAIMGPQNAGWGGCTVWVSEDNATYQRAGQIHGSARAGSLSASLPTSALDPDQAHTLSVDLTKSGGALTSGSTADADSFNTLCYVDGELVSYATATLTAASKYDLTYIRRGAYGTPVSAHPSGSLFARLDQAIFKFPFNESQIGKTLYIKFTSFNEFMAGEEILSDVQVFQYKITGSALLSPLPTPQNFRTAYRDNLQVLTWDQVLDFRSVDYEVRYGTSLSTAQVLGRTATLSMDTIGDGTYWLMAHSFQANQDVYSPAVSIVIAGAIIPRNVIAVLDEAATGWSGTFSGGAAKIDGNAALGGSGDWDAIPDFDLVSDVDYYGGVSPTGYYTIPSSHVVDIGAPSVCRVWATFSAQSLIALLFDQVADVDDLADFDGVVAGKGSAILQMSLSQDGITFGPWQNFTPGQYLAQAFNFRLFLQSFDLSVTEQVSALEINVDMPDLIQSDVNVAVPAIGLSITFQKAFQVTPAINITILSAQQGDDEVLISQDRNGFTVQTVNSGVGVARHINYIAKAY